MENNIRERLAALYAGCGTEATSYADIDAVVAELACLTNRQLDELGAVVCCSGLRSYAPTKAAKLAYIGQTMRDRLASKQRVCGSPFTG